MLHTPTDAPKGRTVTEKNKKNMSLNKNLKDEETLSTQNKPQTYLYSPTKTTTKTPHDGYNFMDTKTREINQQLSNNKIKKLKPNTRNN